MPLEILGHIRSISLIWGLTIKYNPSEYITHYLTVHLLHIESLLSRHWSMKLGLEISIIYTLSIINGLSKFHGNRSRPYDTFCSGGGMKTKLKMGLKWKGVILWGAWMCSVIMAICIFLLLVRQWKFGLVVVLPSWKNLHGRVCLGKKADYQLYILNSQMLISILGLIESSIMQAIGCRGFAHQHHSRAWFHNSRRQGFVILKFFSTNK